MTRVLLGFFWVTHCEKVRFYFYPVTKTKIAHSWQMCPAVHRAERTGKRWIHLQHRLKKNRFQDKNEWCVQSVLKKWNLGLGVEDMKGFFLPAGFRIFPPKLTSTAELTRIPTVLFSGPRVSSKAEIHKVDSKSWKAGHIRTQYDAGYLYVVILYFLT